MSTIKCLKCGEEKPALAKAPYPKALEEMVLKNICELCWAAWQKFSVNVINDYKLRPFMPQDRATLESHMKKFLNLELQNLNPTMTLTGQGKKVTF